MSARTRGPGARPPTTGPGALSERLGRSQQFTCTAIRDAGDNGATAHEVSQITGLDRHSIQPRITELQRKGLVIASGKRRRNPSGKPATVWIATEHADSLAGSSGSGTDRKSAPTPERANAIYCTAHANFADCQPFGASAAFASTFESSLTPRRGEVSILQVEVSRRGGARNRADRAGCSLTTKQIAGLTAAELMARRIGLPLNRFITVHWEAAGVPLEGMVKATGRFVGQLTEWLRRRGHRTAWLWVHENGDGVGAHCHLVAHVPPELVAELTSAQKRWLSKIAGRPYRAKAIKSIPIGGRLGLEAHNPDLHLANLETVVAYVTKQAVAASTTTRFHEPGGRVIGKRCGNSQNIGAKARRSTPGK